MYQDLYTTNICEQYCPVRQKNVVLRPDFSAGRWVCLEGADCFGCSGCPSFPSAKEAGRI